MIALFALMFLWGAADAQDPSSWGQSAPEQLITGADIVVRPGQRLSGAQLHIKNGRIVGVGRRLATGPEVRRLDFSGKVIHAGFIDPFVPAARVGLAKRDRDRPNPSSGGHPRAHDDFRVADTLNLKKGKLKRFREAGFVLLGLAPESGIFRGQGALYRCGDSENDAELLVQPSSYSVLGFKELGWGKLDGENYPLSMMGCVALARQKFAEARWWTTPSQAEKLFDGNLVSLQAVLNGSRPLWAVSEDFGQSLRMLRLFQEQKLPSSALVMSGQEWKKLDWFVPRAKHTDGLILPLKFPKNPKTKDLKRDTAPSLEELQAWFYAPALPRWLSESGLAYSLTTYPGKDLKAFAKGLTEALEAGLEPDAALAALTTEPARLLGVDRDYGSLEPGKVASFVVREGEIFGVKDGVEEVWIEGKRFPRFERYGSGQEAKAKKWKPRKFINRLDYAGPPEVLPRPASPASVLIRGATVWTQDRGTLPNTDMLVSGGKIQAVGQGLSAAAEQIIDAKGLHLTPGMVDAHSHTAIDGMVNEPGARITSMVRIKDVLDPFDHDMYLQLANGVTAANILHGSANAIGGQAVTCKWRYGQAPEGLVMEGAPEGIKFALGENPKQSNWGDKHTSRYPQTRMGVAQLIRGAFVSARNYRRLKAEGKNPKPDLALDALVDVLESRRLIHCHSYRQDEILALMRVAEEVGIRIHVFQHVLEGYKVADELVRHGAHASTFADWWAYKVEVEDAIPHNASLMTEAGVLVSINSDSPDLARRLNTEAAKSLRYGGMSEVQALNLITRNPAEQLGILSRVGTLTPGKDADFVLWKGHPLTQEAIVLQTWIDGQRYFDRGRELQRTKAHEAQRQALLGKLKEKKKK